MSKNIYLLIGLIIIIILGAAVFNNSSSKSGDSTVHLTAVDALNYEGNIFQLSTLNSLSAGNFDGNFSAGELKKYGNTGIGTFNDLDGEMIELNGVIYQVKSNGTIYIVNDSERIPYARVLYSKPDKIVVLNKSMNYTELMAYLNNTIPSKNLGYSFKIIGTFDYVKARSPQEQTKPYPNLTEALKTQSIFNFYNMTGTMVGFWYPASASSIDLNDYHFHIINEKRNSGGHVLDLKSKNVIIEIDYITDIYLFSPINNTYYKFNLTNN